LKHLPNDGSDADDLVPAEAGTTDFNWQQVYRRLNEHSGQTEIDKQSIEAVVRLLKLLVSTSKPRIKPDRVGLRVIALAWLLNPGYFADSPSLRQLARRCGVNHTKLAALTGHFSRLIGWRNRAQRRAWNWRRFDRRA
jgi:hypothetical protein